MNIKLKKFLNDCLSFVNLKAKSIEEINKLKAENKQLKKSIAWCNCGDQIVECGSCSTCTMTTEDDIENLENKIKQLEQIEQRFNELNTKFHEIMKQKNLTAGFFGLEPWQVIKKLADEIEQLKLKR